MRFRRVAAFAFVSACVMGCAADEVEARGGAELLSTRLGATEGTFEDIVPIDLRTSIQHSSDARPRTSAIVSTATALIDATDGKVLFPMPRERRSFADESEMLRFIIETFGADEVTTDERGNPVSARGSYGQHGTSYFEQDGIRYRVSDAMAAFIGGVSGVIELGGELVCLDADGDCVTDRASYLVPVGVPSWLPTHQGLCGPTNVCVEFHSFFNTAPFPPWARHGSNVKFTSYSAIPATQLSTGGRIDVPESLGWDSWPLPNEANTGQDSVESAVWCFGTTSCVEYRARAVCGTGRVTDPDVSGPGRTGNGPDNTSRCF